MFGIKCLFVILSVAFVCHSLRIDKCNIAVKRRKSPQVVIRNNCTVGTLYWSYPKKTLRVTVQEEKGIYQFCIGYINDPLVMTCVVKSSTGSRKLKLPRKSGDKECIVYSGSLSLEFNGPPRMKTYMAFIPYERNEMKSDSRYKDFIKHLK